MNKWMIMAGAVLLVVLVLAVFVWLKRRPKQLKTDYFQEHWLELQKRLRDKAQWGEAVLEADNLLDEALRKRRIRGRNMGERLVKAQRLFTDNDALWFGHKLRSKIDGDPTTKLKETEVKQALIGIRQALKDLGALA
jgi:heme A synthase